MFESIFESKLSSITKARIIIEIIQELSLFDKELKKYIYIDTDYISSHSTVLKRIAKKAGIRTEYYDYNSCINIADDIIMTFDNMCERYARHKFPKLFPKKQSYPRPAGKDFFENYYANITEEVKKLTTDFEAKHIPENSSGPRKTRIAEMLRAIQRIRYRAFNDGDLCWDINSPTYVSYIYLMSQLKQLNDRYYKDPFDFSGMYLPNTFGTKGKGPSHIPSHIVDCIEDELAKGTDEIKWQLIYLLTTGQIEDSPNEFDSRSYTEI